MIWVNVKRITKAGFVNFWRNGWVSLATVLVVIITLFVIGSLIFSRSILSSTITQLQEKVDISIYFKVDTYEENILALKGTIESKDEVKSVEYITREQALENFLERHKDNALITQSLQELGDNPLGAVLNVKAKDPSNYESIANFLNSNLESQSSIIDKVNYFQNKSVIDRLVKITDSAKKLGYSLSLVLIIISILVTFNTIRLAIYTARDEISVMRLVGAGNKFISGPFIIEGIMYGVISSIITITLFYPITIWLGPSTENFFGGFNIFEYYISNFFQIFFILLVTGVAISTISSLIAVRRYLKV